MKKALLFFIILLAILNSLEANQDSLWSIWEDESQPDSIRIECLVGCYSGNLIYDNPDSALVLANIQLDFVTERKDEFRTAKAYHNLGTIYYIKREFDKALEYYNKAVDYYRSIDNLPEATGTFNNMGLIYKSKGDFLSALNNYKLALRYTDTNKYELIGSSNINIANVYRMQNDYLRAIEYFEIGLKYHKLSKKKRGIANALSSIGTMYYEKEEYDKAISYFEQSLKLRQEIESKSDLIKSNSNLGNVYSSLKKYDKSLEYYQKCSEISNEIGDEVNAGYTYNNIAMVQKDLGNLDESLQTLKKSYEISTKYESKNLLAMNLVNFGSIYSAMGKYNESDNWLRKAITLCEELNAISYLQNAYYTLYKNNTKRGNYKKALEYYKEVTALDDSLKSEETYRELQQMEFRSQMAADSLEDLKREAVKDLEIKNKQAALETQNYLIVGIILVLILISIIAYVISKGKKTSDALLQNILPAEVAEELKAKGFSSAKEFDKATILFTDFKDFSKICSNLSASDLVEEIDFFFKKFDSITEKYGLEKIKTIGDSYMAAGGINKESQNPIINTILAGLEMQRTVNSQLENKSNHKGQKFEMRLGIHTGPVIAGIVGVKKFQYDLWGETVNTASRMESYGIVGEVNISEDTYELIKESSLFHFEERKGIEVKSIGLTKMYLVKSKND